MASPEPRDSNSPPRELLQQSPWRTASDIFRAVVRQPAGVIGGLIVVVAVLAAILAPLLAPFDPNTIHPDNVLAGPGHGYALGTDEVGRDVLSRLIYGTRPALLVGALAVLAGGGVGTALGVVAGYRRGIVEVIVMRMCDVVFAFPLILVGICAVVVLGSGVFPVGLAVGLGVFPLFARLARAEVLKETGLDYVMASRSTGAGPRWIIGRHILPNIATTMVVQMAATMSLAIVMASALDFLGLGTQPPTASWGNMLQESRQYLSQDPAFAISPGLVLTIFVLGVNLLAASLTNALNPRLRTRVLRGRSFVARLRRRRSGIVAIDAGHGQSIAIGRDA